MCHFIIIFFVSSFCLNRKEGQVILTDFLNDNSPIYVMAPYYENYTIDLYNSKDVLENTSFSNVETFNNQNIETQIDDFIQFSNELMLSSFCPVDEWGPPYQPARLYLSKASIDLLTYNQTEGYPVQVEQQLHQDLKQLNKSFNSIDCYSIFQLIKNNQFAIDCNINEKPAILKFQLKFNSVTQIITNFTYINMFYYTYIEQEQQDFLANCLFRKSLNIQVFSSDLDLDLNFLQYCVGISSFNNMFLIINTFVVQNGTYILNANTNYVENLQCQSSQNSQIEQVFTNQMTNGYDNQTWNLGFLFESKPTICKCRVLQETKYLYQINCASTLIELYKPKQIRKITNLNDEVVLVTGNNEAVLAIYLERSYQSQNYYTISYQQIFEPDYILIDITITSQYLGVILTNQIDFYNTQPYQNDPNLFCSQPQIQGAQNLLKIYYLNPQQKQVYFSSNQIPDFARFFQTLSLSNFGNFFLLFDYYNSALNIMSLSNKQLLVSYQYGQNNISDIEANSIVPSIISFNISGSYTINNQTDQSVTQFSINFSRQIIICYIKFDDINFYLIANFYKFQKNNNYTLTQCPISQDFLIFQEIINSIDLFDGIFGPLLNFHYIPNYNQSKFYPFYQNHKSVIQKNHYIEKYSDHNYYKILRSINKNIYITQNIFGIIETFITYNETNRTISMIYNQTCVINALENSNMAKQFPVKIEIQDCNVRLYRNLSKLMNQVDYYKEFDYYDFAAQYNYSTIVFCLKFKYLRIQQYCQNIKIFNQTKSVIKQLYISQGPLTNDKISYFITVLYNDDLYKLKFYLIEILVPEIIQSQEKTYFSDQYYKLTTPNPIVNFKYTYLFQQTLFVLLDNAQIVIYTPGPINSTNSKGQLYFTSMLLNKTLNLQDCQNYTSIGFEITNYFQSKFAKQYLIVWCQLGLENDFRPLIFQYIINQINQITFWRQLPLYDTVLSDKSEIILSGLILYVPIIKKTVYQSYFQNYYIYNLNDYTARSLVEKIEIEKRKGENIILYPIEDLLSSMLSGSSISLTLIITSKKFEIYYLNQKAEFVFHLQQQFIPLYNQQPFVLVIAIFQPRKTLTLYRNYTILYNFSSTQITFFKDKSKPYKIWINPANLTEAGGFYKYLLLINQYFFEGPISSYQLTSNLSNLTVIPSPYLEVNKYLGNYMDEVVVLGQVTQIIDIGDEIYTGLFTINLPNVTTYQDLVLVLTDQHIIFYQKSSLQSSDNKSCIFTNYSQNYSNQNQSQCQIRIIHNHTHYLDKTFNQEDFFCQMQLNGVNALLIVCQTRYFNTENKMISFDKINNQIFYYLEYIYDQTYNSIFVTQNISDAKQYCYCYYNDLQPFVYNQQVYQVIKKSYQKLNTYFGIYQVIGYNDTISFIQNSSYPDQNSSIPFEYAEDFALTVIQYQNNNFLYLIMIQPNNIFVLVINLVQNFPLHNYGQNLQFSEEEDFVRLEDAIFIQCINHFQPYPIMNDTQKQVIVIGNNNQIYEVEFDVFTFKAKLTHTFYQYLLCHFDYLSRPQIEIQYENDTVFYLVTQCLSNQFEYQSLQVEMTYMLNELNTNIVYTSLFVRNYSTNYTRPVEILEPYLVNPQDLHFQKIQIYQVFNELHTYSYSHLLISNSTYFLIDLFMFSSNGYYLYYPTDLVQQNQNHSIKINITAFNSYSTCEVEFELLWQKEEGEISSKTWFFVIIGLIALFLIIMIVSVIYTKSKKRDEMMQYDFGQKSEYNEYKEVEMQRPENKLFLGDLLRDFMKAKTDNDYEIIE